MKALVVRQPWASLIAHGVKTIETRGFQPRTTLVPGDQLAIVAGRTVPKGGSRIGEWHLDAYQNPGRGWVGMWRLEGVGRDRHPRSYVLPLGAVVAVVTYDGALPMEPCPPYSSSFDDRWEPPAGGVIYLGGLDGGPWAFDAPGSGPWPLTDQLPLGDFRPGRYGWLLSDPQRIDPVPCPAVRPDGTRTVMQGIFTLPDDVAGPVEAQLR